MDETDGSVDATADRSMLVLQIAIGMAAAIAAILLSFVH
jgi:hypothetical protein